jgi:hypothetical protein
MKTGIENGTIVRFKEILDAGDEKALMFVLDDYGTDSERCLVQYLCTGLALKPTKVHLKSELVIAELTPFQKQDIFHEAMIAAYLNGQIQEPMFKPYFDWKLGKTTKMEVSKEDAQAIINKASEMLEPYFEKYPDAESDNNESNNDIWCYYQGYGEDKYIVSYLQKIEEEVTNFLIGGFC